MEVLTHNGVQKMTKKQLMAKFKKNDFSRLQLRKRLGRRKLTRFHHIGDDQEVPVCILKKIPDKFLPGGGYQ